jgi:tetratricopeptide (TPR) repeat protein
MEFNIIDIIRKTVAIGQHIILFDDNHKELGAGKLVEILDDFLILEFDYRKRFIPGNKIGFFDLSDEEYIPEAREGNGNPERNSSVSPPPISTREDTVVNETPQAPAAPSPDASASHLGTPGQTADRNDLSQEFERKLLEIQIGFETRAKSARLDLWPPNFQVFPQEEEETLKGSGGWNKWHGVKSSYEHAYKVKELTPKYGRVEDLIRRMRGLKEEFPLISTFYRHLGFLYFLQERYTDAAQCYQDAALISESEEDWYNYGVSSWHADNRMATFRGLEQYFINIGPRPDKGAWDVFLVLSAEFSHLCWGREVFSKGSTGEEGGLDSKQASNALVFLLLKTGNKDKEVWIDKWLEEGKMQEELLPEVLAQFQEVSNPDYEAFKQGQKKKVEVKKTKKIELPEDNRGIIYNFLADRNFGFIKGERSGNYFFHRSAVSDEDLLERLKSVGRSNKLSIPVIFEPADGPKGPVALGLSLERTLEEIYARALDYAEAGDYHRAIAQIKKIPPSDPIYALAQEQYLKWVEFERVRGVPKGASPYPRAKRAHILENDLPKAARLFKQAIEEGDNVSSAVKDLASLYVQMRKPEKAIETLKQYQKIIPDQRSIDNMLIGFYQNAGQNEEAIELLKQKMVGVNDDLKKASIRWQIANAYMRSQDYVEAEKEFRAVLRTQQDNEGAKRNIAYCLFQRGNYDEAESILKEILKTSLDPESADLLAAIDRIRQGGSISEDEITIEMKLSDFSRKISDFSEFILDRCNFRGVPPERAQEGKFTKRDIQKLDTEGGKLGTKRPDERAEYYLSAAKISSILEEEAPDRFYRYLCRSFTSRGDAIVIDGKRHPDAAREFYCEALSVYDGVRDRNNTGDEQDASNALARYLYSTLGPSQIPIKPNLPPLDHTLDSILPKHPDRKQLFDYIGYLIFRSRFAANRILKPLFHKATYQAMALSYLESCGISPPNRLEELSEFVGLWNEFQRKYFEEYRGFTNDLRVLRKLDLNTTSLDDGLDRLDRLTNRLFFDLDRQRVTELSRLAKLALEMVQQESFEDQERLCNQIIEGCDELLKEIERSPTKHSVEDMYPLIEPLKRKVEAKREELYEGSTPEINLWLPFESFVPDEDQEYLINPQVFIKNKMGCSPADALELVIQEEEDVFQLVHTEIKSPVSLRGGDERFLEVPIRVGEKAMASQTFSMPVYLQYRTRSGETERTELKSLSIRLDSKEEFEEIPNPYARYAEGGIVSDEEMFFGRRDLIKNVAHAIRTVREESKCVVIFGQKRAGKSSILLHLKNELTPENDLLILDLGNLGSVFDVKSQYPFEYLLLWEILKKLRYAIEDRQYESNLELNGFEMPVQDDFYRAPSSLGYFKEKLEHFYRVSKKSEGWKRIKMVLFIDEFSYIYNYILAGAIPEAFMKTWKALLQENFFSAVLAGQDVMPKFKQRFPNEFGTTQDERVTYLKQDDAILLIDKPIRILREDGSTESRYREKAIERILYLTAGSPFYIQIICNRLVEYMNRKRARLVTQADVEQVKEELIRGANSLSLDKFENLFNSGDTGEDAISDKDILRVLTIIAQHSKSLQGHCSRHNIQCKTETPIDDILDDLDKRDVVEKKSGQFYAIRVGLFKEWLQVHPIE